MTLTHSTYGVEDLRTEFWSGNFKRSFRTPRYSGG